MNRYGAFPYEDDLDTGIDFDNGQFTHVSPDVSIRYICPKCGGGFHSWNIPSPSEPKRCPFCHTEAGDFGEKDEDGQSREELKEELEEARDTIDQLESALEEVRGAFE